MGKKEKKQISKGRHTHRPERGPSRKNKIETQQITKIATLPYAAVVSFGKERQLDADRQKKKKTSPLLPPSLSRAGPLGDCSRYLPIYALIVCVDPLNLHCESFVSFFLVVTIFRVHKVYRGFSANKSSSNNTRETSSAHTKTCTNRTLTLRCAAAVAAFFWPRVAVGRVLEIMTVFQS